MNNQQLSKSARRRLRQQAKAQTTVVVTQPAAPQPAGRGRSRSARRRRNRRRGQTASHNEYLNSLMYPETCRGCKIPDLTAYPSSTFTLTHDMVLSNGVGGDSNYFQLTPIIGDNSTCFPMVTRSGTTTGSLANSFNVNWNARADIISHFSSVRCVSASIVAQYFGASGTDSGLVSGGMVGKNQSTAFVTYNATQTALNLETVPVRNGMRVVWKPQDNESFEYFGTANEQLEMFGAIPTIFVAFTGLTTSSSLIRITATANFEAITSTGSEDFSTENHNSPDTPSPVNLGWLEQATNWASEIGNNISPLFNMASSVANQLQGPATNLAARFVTNQLINYGARQGVNRRQRIEL